MMDMAVQLISRKSAPFDPDVFKDSYGVALRELVEEKAKGHTILSPPTRRSRRAMSSISRMR